MRIASRTAAVCLLLTLVPVAADAQDSPMRDRLRARLAERMESDRVTGGEVHAYGRDPLQTLSVWRPKTAGPAPLIVFVHGGGWKRGSAETATGAAKVEHFTAAGYAVASIDYRLVPAATVEQQAGDVAAAVAWLRAHATALGIDPGRIVLMGHSAGAHLVALVGTDPAYLAAAGLKPDAVRGVVAIDGAAYDVPAQVAAGGSFMAGVYADAFGSDGARQRALSPTLHAGAPNAPAFLLLHVQRRDGIAQAEALAAALRRAGTPVTIQGFAGDGLRGHMEINRSLGRADYPATPVVDRWLGARFEQDPPGAETRAPAAGPLTPY